VLHGVIPHSHPWEHEAQASEGGGHAGHGAAAADAGALHDGHATFADGKTVDHAGNGFDPHELLRDFDWGRTHRTASGRVVREWTLTALDKEIEVAPGVSFAAWT